MQTSSEKLWTFVQLKKLKLEESKHQLIRQLSFDQIRTSIRTSVTWRRVAWMDALIHTVLGFVIVTAVAISVPEVINNVTRLAVFWVVMFTHLILGFLSFVGLYRNSSITLKLIAAGLIILQLSVLGITSNCKAECAKASFLAAGGGGGTSSTSMPPPEPQMSEEDCRHLSYLSSHIILPNFIHSFIFCAILIIFLYKKASVVRVRDDFSIRNSGGNLDPKQTYQFANITVIVEEVV